MDNYLQIKKRLEAFIRKFHLNKLLKGLVLFLTIGLLYLLAVLAIEYFLWLDPWSRTFLFWMFIGVEVLLLIYFIMIPIAKLFKISKGINEEEASKIIGSHFPEVKDKLLNILQLKKDGPSSELLLASIEQKSAELNNIPFTRAVDYRESGKFLKYALFPIMLILGLLVTGKIDLVAAPLERLTKYNIAFEAPAPFRFVIINDSLKATENSAFKILVKTEGKLTPERAEISYNGQTYFLKEIAPGNFEYNFKRLRNDVKFNLRSNGVSSKTYILETLKIPKLLNFTMVFDYPDYIEKTSDSLSGTGNVNLPEGTEITWRFNTRNTDIINFSTSNTSVVIPAESYGSQYSQVVKSRFNYRVSTSNNAFKDFEALTYSVNMIKDEYPQMEIQQKLDTIDNSTQYFYGKISDDYGLKRLNLVYYIDNKQDSINKQQISITNQTFDEFHYTFPGDLDLIPGKTYNFYFQLWDNDAVNGSKNTKSVVFSFKKKTAEDIEEEKLEEQKRSIDKLGESLSNIKSSQEELNELNRIQKENKNFDYNERRRLENYINRQSQQTEMMREYSEKLRKTLESKKEFDSNPKDKEQLKIRLERTKERLKKDELLLEELQKMAEKIKREELGQRLEELSKRNQTEERNLEQLLELTKRYYVEEKLQKLADNLKRLAEKQLKLSEISDNESLKEQKEISKEFEHLRKELRMLEKENGELKKPTEFPVDNVAEEFIRKQLDEAEKNLERGDEKRANENQKDASKQMEELSAKMQKRSNQQSLELLKANIESLRQILDNLITFSFQQEELLKDFNEIEINNPRYAVKLIRQNDLRSNFRHIDDSLYTLALSNPMITEDITKSLTNIEFNIEKSLERLAQNELPQGTASQQYVVTGANDLAYMLSRILTMMERQANPKMGRGKGQNSEFQLQDIIKEQQSIIKEFQKRSKEEPVNPTQGRKPGEGMGEEEMKNLFEIYKNQQQLRQRLQELNMKNSSQEHRQLEEQIKKVEDQMLNKGFDRSVLKQLQQLEQELLEFEKARNMQGKNNKRNSKTNYEIFDNPAKAQSIKAKEYFNSIEILNRHSLPLREIYKQKVKSYFERTNN
jgi:hypothetical protein